MSGSYERPDLRMVIAACTVLAWRLAAALSPYREGRLGSMSSTAVDRLLLGGMGVVFVACALGVHCLRRDRAASAFVLFGLASGLHWGGPIRLAFEPLETVLFVAYLAISDLLAAAWRVQLGRQILSPSASGRRRWWLLYTPACVAATAGLALGLLPEESPPASMSRAVLGASLATSTLLGVLFVGMLVIAALRPRATAVPRRLVLAMLAAFVLASMPYLLGAPDVYSLSFLLEAFVYPYVLLAGTRIEDARNLDGSRR